MSKRMEPNPRLKANLVSKLFFVYTFDLFRKGLVRGLQFIDLYNVLPHLDSKKLGAKLEKSKFRENDTIFTFLWRHYGVYYLLMNTTQILNIAISAVSPRLISKIVSYYIPGQKNVTAQDLIIYGSILITISYVKNIYLQNFGLWASSIAVEIRSAMISYIYRRTLETKTYELNCENFLGKLTTIITNDLTGFERFIRYVTVTWPEIVKILVTFYVLYTGIGGLVWVSLILFLLFLLFQIFIGYLIFKAALKQNVKTEERLELSKLILSENKTIKTYTWEDYLIQKMDVIRRKEAKYYFLGFVLIIIILTHGIFNYRLSILITLLVGSWYKYSLNVASIYFIISCFNVISSSLQISFPVIIYWAANLGSSLKRTTQFLQLLKHYEMKNDEMYNAKQSKNPEISLDNISLIFMNKIVFNKASLNVKNGLVLIRGFTGGGKTALLRLISKFYKPSEGVVKVDGVISYASQEPWLFPGTIRENIIFTEDYDEKRYRDILKICALEKDLLALENSDSTLVANRGLNLSKGQRMRINLARAVYKKADIYLLDDCLSSLDIIVSNYIFKKCVIDYLNGKIVLFVSHREIYMKYVDSIVEISKLKIKLESVKKKGNFKLVSDIKGVQKLEDVDEEDENVGEESLLLKQHLKSFRNEDESINSGGVKWKIYYRMFALGGWFLIFLAFVCLFLAQLIISYSDRYVNTWIRLENQIANYTSHNLTLSDNFANLIIQRKKFVVTYAILLVTLTIFALARELSVYYIFKNISVNIHNNLMTALMKAEYKFFDKTSLGNIMNRLSMDLYYTDKLLPQMAWTAIKQFFTLTGIFVVISLVNINFLPYCIVVMLMHLILRYIYLKTARQIRRLSLAARSSVIGLLTATLDGLSTIKALKAESKMKEDFDRYHNHYISASYMYETCIRTFILASELCSATLVAIVVAKYTFFADGNHAEHVGLALSQAIATTSVIYSWLLQWAEIETLMTSVERLFQFIDTKIENDDGNDIDDFPKKGEISYQKVSMRYSESGHYVLKNLCFTIKPTEKFGIVGRTGSGKSSIISALFRLYSIDGKILIDGVDHTTLSLKCLRSNISIIPQDTLLFDGSIRENIDPLGNHTDDEIWKVLEVVEMKPLFASLDFLITGETSLSSGQKQLISLARVLIKNNRIIVFDEASENMDHQMSLLLKNILQRNNKECTIISIAHKLDFVLGCDRILVLDEGEIVELDYTSTLLRVKNSLFYKMAQEDGLILQ